MTPVTCDNCGRTGVPVPIVYGYPTDATVELARQGRAILGGCMFDPSDPRFGCRRCEAQFSPLEIAATGSGRAGEEEAE